MLLQHHRDQVTVERMAAHLRARGVSTSKLQVQRLPMLIICNYLAQDRAVLRAGLQTAAWIAVYDTAVRCCPNSAPSVLGWNSGCPKSGTCALWPSTGRREAIVRLLRRHLSDFVVSRSSGADPQIRLAPMNVLPRDKEITVIAALSERMSIRSFERLTEHPLRCKRRDGSTWRRAALYDEGCSGRSSADERVGRERSYDWS